MYGVLYRRTRAEYIEKTAPTLENKNSVDREITLSTAFSFGFEVLLEVNDGFEGR